MKKTTLLIDWDDTLWDFQANSLIALKIMYEQESLDTYFPSFEMFHNIYIVKNHDLWSQYGRSEITKDFLSIERFSYPLRNAGCDDIKKAERMSETYLKLTSAQTTLVAGAREVVKALAAKYRLVIISNGFIEVQYQKINASGLAQYFDEIILSEQVGVQKPNKQFFDYTLEKISAKAEECIVIGDSFENDIMGAANANIDAIYFNRDKNNTPTIREHDRMITSLDELLSCEI